MDKPRNIIARQKLDGQAIGRAGADRIIDRLTRAGFAIVPVEPTEEMHEAANREWDGRMSARVCGVWQAMLRASQTQGDSNDS